MAHRLEQQFEVCSPLPQNGSDFEGHRHAGAVRCDARRIVPGGTGCRDRCTIDPPTRFARRLDAAHLLSDCTAAIDPIGIQLDSHGVRIDVIEIHLSLKDMLVRTSWSLYIAGSFS